MFKNNLSSFLLPQWWKRKVANTNTSSDVVEAPKEFVISSADNKNKLVNVSMEENEDSFVNIDYKELTYAEAAALSLDKEARPVATVKGPTPHSFNDLMKEIYKRDIVSENRMDAPPDIYDYNKNAIKYQKSKEYKNKQHKMIQKKKAKKASAKQGKNL